MRLTSLTNTDVSLSTKFFSGETHSICFRTDHYIRPQGVKGGQCCFLNEYRKHLRNKNRKVYSNLEYSKTQLDEWQTRSEKAHNFLNSLMYKKIYWSSIYVVCAAHVPCTLCSSIYFVPAPGGMLWGKWIFLSGTMLLNESSSKGRHCLKYLHIVLYVEDE